MVKSFSEFCAVIKERILKGWVPPEDYEAYLYPVRKNNGCVKTGLYIRRKEEGAMRLIYLEEYYDCYRQGLDMDRVITMIRNNYDLTGNAVLECKISDLTMEDMAERVIFRLVNYERNEDQLKTCPHVKIGDLAVTFRFIASYNDSGMGSVMINYQLMEHWGVDFQTLLGCATNNMPRLFPPKYIPLREITAGLFEECSLSAPDEDSGEEDFMEAQVLTNESGINGASSILYPSCLMDFAARNQMDYYILPSSIHEVILVPVDDGPDPDTLRKMIREVNREVVDDQDYLSDSLYIFERSCGMVRIL